jgi:hypothetical protein
MAAFIRRTISALALLLLCDSIPAAAIEQFGSGSGAIWNDEDKPSELPFDLDGDGGQEIVYTTDLEGHVYHVRKLFGADLWTFDGDAAGICADCVSLTWVDLIGFADLDPTPGREAVVRWGGCVSAECPPYVVGVAVVATSSSAVIKNFLGAWGCPLLDLTGDANEEILVDFENGHWEVWGRDGSAAGVALKAPNGIGVRPNPARDRVTIALRLAAEGEVSVRILSVQGSLVRDLGSMRCPAGSTMIPWDGQSGDGRRVPPGVYFADVTVDGDRQPRRLVMLR